MSNKYFITKDPAWRDKKIDVLRGVAVFAVLLFHTHNAWYLDASGDLADIDRFRLSDTLIGLFSIPVTFGFLGLNVFFILSGMCIHLWTLKRQAKSPEWSYKFFPYIKRRITRLYPAYLGAIIFSLICLAITEWIRIELMGFTSVSHFAQDLIQKIFSYLTFTHTLSVSTFSGFNTPLYTMAIEFHLYLLYPIALYGISIIGVKRTLYITLALSALVTVYVKHTGDPVLDRLIMDSALARWPEWVAGCVLAEYMFSKNPSITFPCVRTSLFLGFLLLSAAAAIQIKYALTLNVLWSAGLFFLILNYIRSNHAFYWIEKHLVFLGMISYSVYLLHWPILRFLAIAVDPAPHSSILLINLCLYLAIIPVIIFLGWISFNLLELPFLRQHKSK